jgi:hypothetical protein
MRRMEVRVFKGYAIGLGCGAVQLVREYSRRLTQVQEMHHRLGEAIHFVRSAKGEQPGLEPLLQECPEGLGLGLAWPTPQPRAQTILLGS